MWLISVVLYDKGSFCLMVTCYSISVTIWPLTVKTKDTHFIPIKISRHTLWTANMDTEMFSLSLLHFPRVRITTNKEKNGLQPVSGIFSNSNKVSCNSDVLLLCGRKQTSRKYKECFSLCNFTPPSPLNKKKEKKNRHNIKWDLLHELTKYCKWSSC